MKNYLEHYLKNRPFFYIFIRPKEAELFSRFLPFRKPVCDFGCGDGFFAKTFLPEGKINWGVDINKDELQKARLMGVYDNLEYYNQKKLGFKDGEFATVISNCALEHVENLEHDLTEINRILKPGGVFLCSVMTSKWDEYLLGGKIFGRFYRNWMRKIQKHPNLLTKKQWDMVFKRAGFKIEKRIGYIDIKLTRLIEIFHFLSIESLITYKLFGKWVILPQRYFLFPSTWISSILFKDLNESKSACVFYKLKK